MQIDVQDAIAVVAAEAEKCRTHASQCVKWSAAQGEWLRANDACLNIIDKLREMKPA